MQITRREFQLYIAAAAAAALPLPAALAHEGPRRQLRVLVLGGTQFVGIHVVNAALRRGHRVTLFNRGRTNPELFPQVEKLRGDRDGDLGALRGRGWDCAIDDSGLVPRQVESSTALLSGNVAQYLFVSSTDAYADYAQPNSEESALQPVPVDVIGRADGGGYGVSKVIGEAYVRAAFPTGALILRPCQIVGPMDPAARVAFWIATAWRGGRLPAPGRQEDPIQYIDARDLANFALDMLEAGNTGTYNVASEPRRFSIGGLVSACVDSITQTQPTLPVEPVWMTRRFLESHRAAGLFPLWPGQRTELGLPLTDTRRALSAGLRVSPLELTVGDTMKWLLSQPGQQQAALRVGPSADLQRRLLADWDSSGGDA